jgi:hypothetical protein
MIEIYLTCSIAPIPFSTMVNREWGHIGNSCLKTLFALAFQGFLIMVCVATYAILLQTITSESNIHAAIWGCAGYTVLLCFTLFKTGSVAKSIFGYLQILPYRKENFVDNQKPNDALYDKLAAEYEAYADALKAKSKDEALIMAGLKRMSPNVTGLNESALDNVIMASRQSDKSREQRH